ncbi:OmpA family protein [Rhodopirellula sp. JC740]|uniref:OmpA family protein n=1 Tax=Rhodopirellula halodulae TaxID=2894198 RepID=A0ABS8NBM2_9BACT|nr:MULTISPECIES: OmpA family protein [unclassified Rhodopirellula]MCC9640939.1 OmpA family protein [Rhodopirellula sp. JC740]MCC9656453.1 OmpA family protein [Rhodopirellula sp. JC737]
MNAFRQRIELAFFAVAFGWACVGLGCSQNPYLAGGGTTVWQPPSNTAAVNGIQAQVAELNRRVQLLDDNNRQLTTQLAQSEQQAQVYRDELNLVRKQLSDTTQQYDAARIAAQDAQNQARSFQASAQMRGGATIRANTNLNQLAGRLNLGGLKVEQDGEVLRVVLPSDQLFAPGTAQLQPAAGSVLDPAAAQLRSVFPRQRIGIEGYTDNAPMYGGAAGSAHQLTSAQAAAVLDWLTRRSGMPAQQLFTVAQGSNNPRQDNTTPAGRAANRRVELVVYPETF